MVSDNSLLSSSDDRSPKLSNSFTTNRIFSDVAEDVTIVVDGESFLLHMFPLAAWSGKIRKLVTEEKGSIKLESLPGGLGIFELVAKFCYGAEFEITATNVVALHCAAEYLEMSEKVRRDNLLRRTEEYLSDVAAPSLEKSLEVLSACEEIPAAEIASRFAEAVARNSPEPEDLSGLGIGAFELVVRAMGSAGAPAESVVATLVGRAGKCTEQEDQPNVVETLAGLIPPEDDANLPLWFLFRLLRAASAFGANDACRVGLESRIALRLDLASVDDLLALFDVDAVSRLIDGFLKRIDNDDVSLDDEEEGSPDRHEALLKIGRLVDEYLAEIAPDPCLSLQKFTAVIELLPNHARVIDDGLYRAVDIYLKAHPKITEAECKKLCKSIDCGKLSQDACNHVARNERIPVQMSVKVVYFEQLRLRAALSEGPPPSSGAVSPRDNYASLRRENRELRLEISRMRARLSELEKEQESMRRGETGGGGETFLMSISRGIERIGIFGSGPGRKRKGRKSAGQKRHFVS